jgi:hypothetical protein
MARIDIEASLRSGFSVIRHRPGAVMLWGLVHVVVIGAFFAAMGPFYLAMFSQMSAAGSTDPTASQQAITAMMPQFMAMQGWMMLGGLALGFVGVMVYCAAFRAVLHPEQSRLGYLRVGMPEVFLFVIVYAAQFAIGIALFIAFLLGALIVGVLFAVHAGALGVAVGVLCCVTALVGLVWVGLRFSMIGPMMVHDGKFHLGESWTLTEGHAVDLFIIAISLAAILIVAEMVIVGVLMVVGVAAFAAFSGGAANYLTHLHNNPSAVLAAVAPLLVVGAILWIPLTGCFLAIWNAPWARAYLDLTAPEPDPAAGAI